MADLPLPTSLAEVRCFMGLASFYGKVIENFGAITTSITDCLKKGKFVWTIEA